MNDQWRLDGACVVVTGAAAGIGAATARQLAGLGAHVVGVDVDKTGLDTVRETLAGHGLEVTPVVSDLMAPDAPAAVARQVQELGLPLKALVNNVGANRKSAFVEVTDEDWARTLDLNLTATFRLTRELTPALLVAPGGGAIVNVSSVHGLRGQPGATAYATTKAGLVGFTRQLAAEHAADGLRVNVVCPGLTLTERIRARGADPAQDALRDRLLSGRFAEPEEVASAITFLASDAASYISGVVLPVDGGFTAR